MEPATRLPRPDEDYAYFLDVDGTLVEIAETPDAVEAGPRVKAVLARLAEASGGAVALISGRAIATLDAIFAPLRLAAAGLHGLERRDARGRIHRPPAPPEGFDRLSEALSAFAGARPGLLVENKGLTIALHYRRAPEYAAEVAAIATRLCDGIASRFTVQRGKMMVEFRPPGASKGDAVEAFMSEPPFAGRRPLFIGDDVTDEDGFAAANRAGGTSIRIGDDTATQAKWQAADIKQLLDWLERAPKAA